jgi:hypothetical protein
MDALKLDQICESVALESPDVVVELDVLDLCLIGGGNGEVIFGR